MIKFYKRYLYEPELLLMAVILRRFSLFFLMALFSCYCNAQNNAWLQGSWKGKSYLPGSDATQYFSLRLRVVEIKGNKFEGYLSTMEPYDTTIRYDAKINGEFYGNYLTIKSSKIVYVKNSPGSKWLLSCINCKPPRMMFGLQDGKFYIKGAVEECYPQCMGTSEFIKDINEFSTKDQDSVYALMHMENPNKEQLVVTATPKVVVEEVKKEEDVIVRTVLKPTGFEVLNIGKNIQPEVPLALNKQANKKSAFAVKDDYKKPQPLAEEKKNIVVDTMAIVATEKPVVNKPVIHDSISLLPKGYTERKVNVVRTVNVNTDSIIIRVYDNGVVDGDIVSVVYNDNVVIDKLSLISRAYTIKIPVKPEGNNTLVFHAHNLGEFPPNTAKLEIIYGNKREELTISSDYTVSSSVNIVYTK